MLEECLACNVSVVDEVVHLVFGIAFGNVCYSYAIGGVCSLLESDIRVCRHLNAADEYVVGIDSMS